MKKLIPILLLAGATLLSGCGDSDPNVVSGLQGNRVLSVPVSQDDTYSVNQDTTLTVSAANGVLANDTPNGGTLTFVTTTTQGGTVAGNADGSFTYTPVAGFAGADTFTYIVTNGSGSGTGTVTITVAAVNGYFVDAVNGNDATGSFTGGMPFQTIQAAAAAAPAGSDIVVRPGSYTGAINLENGDRLLGAGSTPVIPQGATRPVLTGPVVLADGNTVDFLRIENSPGLGIDGSGQAGGTVTRCEVVNSSGLSAIEVSPGTGTWRFSNNTLANNQVNALVIRTTGAGQMVATVNGNSITGNGSRALIFSTEDTSQCTAQVHGNVMTENLGSFTFQVLLQNTAIFCLDLENNQYDELFLSNLSTGSVLNVEELVIGPPHSIPSNTGIVRIDTGPGFSDPTSRADGFCGF